MSRPVLFPAKTAVKLAQGTELVPAYPTGSPCHVESVSNNQKNMVVKYRNGNSRTWKVSHICKYYVVKGSEKHKKLIEKGVSSFIRGKRK